MSRGGRLDAVVWDRFAGDRDALRDAAERIRLDRDWRTLAGEGTATSGAPRVLATAIEALHADTFAVGRDAATLVAQRREQQLVLAYQAHLESQGHAVVRHKYSIDGRSLYCDLFDQTTSTLHEAKGDVSREAIRMAVGQLLDYRRFYADPHPRVVVLVPHRPSDDLLRFLTSVGVGVVFRVSGGEWEGVT